MTDQDMMAVKAIAPFEVAEIFAAWDSRWQASRALPQSDMTISELGPPRPGWQDESSADFGHRVAVALFTLLKEV